MVADPTTIQTDLAIDRKPSIASNVAGEADRLAVTHLRPEHEVVGYGSHRTAWSLTPLHKSTKLQFERGSPMGTMISKWRPSWWTEDIHGTAWERIKEAMRRDWMQTRHDLGVGGHEMNQTLTDTVRQAAAKEHLPTINEANPPKVIGEWIEAEIPYGYGYGARTEFGAQHPQWNEGLEQLLEGEWVAAEDDVRYDWGTVRSLVRCGYEFHENESAGIQADVSASTHAPNEEHPSHR